ncbi:phosphoglycerate mutase family protein [Treponema primitia ZAS-2]|uniref:Phosphoglycerate mutase family protein n=1 Tax=Treponema primitia (strain ATCC BAA-887 / DSM 12427 / ZAS-2) TaxID=545694 RepID=F5YNM7_TREPZ|nr:histidine phosphatase family protein [Treponema primitia]AEF83616.1 phosphoglycerate mutase family protein [Treponema primitia ZAS-2]
MKKFGLILVVLLAICSLSVFAGGGKDGGKDGGQDSAKANPEILTIYVVRHGQTIFNLMDRVQGISDGILTERGIVGAVNMGKGLRDIKFDNVYSSDLKRASETARLALEQNRVTKNWTVKELSELREVSFGIFEGDPNYMMYVAFGKDLGVQVPADAKTIAAAAAPIQEYYHGDFGTFLEGLADFNKRVDTQYKISEDASEVYVRLQAGVDKIIAENPSGGNVMLVAHGQSITFLLKQINVELPPGTGLGNSSVTKIVYNYADKTFTLEGTVGDMSYAEAGAKL